LTIGKKSNIIVSGSKGCIKYGDIFLRRDKVLRVQRKRILLIEEEESLRDMMVDILKIDYDCVPVPNGEEGIAYLEKNLGEIGLIIMDMGMSGEAGYAILERIRKSPQQKNILVLIMTELEQLQDITHAFDIGVDDIIVKPVNPDILKQRVNNMFNIAENTLVHNVMEDLIRTEIDENIVNLGICPCPICRKDLLALTLNNVKPKYVSTEKGEIITKAGSLASWEGRMKLLAEVTHYASLIKEKPRHG